eukprot:scaffold26537_cov109-Isochrysis_galbana.AAC.3
MSDATCRQPQRSLSLVAEQGMDPAHYNYVRRRGTASSPTCAASSRRGSRIWSAAPMAPRLPT